MSESPASSTALATTTSQQQLRVAPAPQFNTKNKLEYCKVLAQSDLLPPQYRNKVGNVFMALEVAEAAHMPAITVLLNTHFIMGRPTNSAGMIQSLVRRAGHRLRVKGDENSATCWITRKDDPDFTYEVTWTREMAKKAGLFDKKDSLWPKYCRELLKARCCSGCARDACHEALMGMDYVYEELESGESPDLPHVAVFVDDGRPQDTENGQRFINLGKQRFGGEKEAFKAWIKANFGKAFGELSVAEMQAGGDLLATELGQVQEFQDVEEAELVPGFDPVDPGASAVPAEDVTEDHAFEQRRFFAVLKEKGLEAHYEGAVCWWAGETCGWAKGKKDRPSLSATEPQNVRLASNMLTDMDADQVALILEDYRCWKEDNAKT